MADDAEILAVLGPTASGKSALALRLCEQLGGEIIATDALMVYRGFDIGTNKPSADERARVPHHLIDVRDWNEPMNAAVYSELAAQAIRDILARGKRPVMVVGTYLYYRALLYGLVEVPASDPATRAELEACEAREPGFLAREVARVDPESFREAGSGKNLHRLVRALEIFRLTGSPASVLRRAHGFPSARFRAQAVVLKPDRLQLAERIDRRVAEMFRRGWVDEVRGLLERGVPPEARPMQAVGYRSIALALGSGPVDERALGERIAAETRQYARRQRSFFKQEETAATLECFGEEAGSLGPLAL